MKKILLGLIFSIMLIVFVALSSQQNIAFAQENSNPITLTPTRSALLTDVNEDIDLTQININASFGEITMNSATLTSPSSAVVFDGDMMTITEVGVFRVNVVHNNQMFVVTVISKLTTDTEYVIYEEDFSGMANGPLPAGYTQVAGSAAILNEQLWLSASGGTSMVLLPDYLQSFTNYIIETDFTIREADNNSRWASVMFRYSTENYFQMAVRKDASAANGVEFAKRIDGGWNVPATAAFTEVLQNNKMYRLSIDVFDTTVKESIDGNELIVYDNAIEFSYGKIGMQANGSNAYYDNIRITLPVDYIVEEKFEFAPIANVYEANSNLIAPATVITYAENETQLNSLLTDARPATIVFELNDNGQVIDDEGNEWMSPFDAMVKINGLAIPAFYTNDIDVAIELADFLREYRVRDVFLFSDNGEVILAARNVNNLIRGVLNFTFDDTVTVLEVEDLLNIRKETNRHQAVAAIIPNHLMNKEVFTYLHTRAMTIWTTADGNSQSSLYRALLSGAHGIVTNNPNSLYSIYETFPTNTIIRRPLTIGHRGLPSLSPENTIESALLAYEYGADILEMDVHLTLDFEVIVIHDGTTNRTTDGNLVVAQSRLDQIRELTIMDPTGNYPELKIPTLGEYFEAIKGLDTVIFLEIKPLNPLLVQFIIETIEEYDMHDQVAFIAFGAGNIQSYNEMYPEGSNGFLTGALLNPNNPEGSILNVLTSVVPMNATFNPHFGSLRLDVINGLRHRGISVWPWTINDLSQLSQFYLYGVDGITTDYTQHLENTWDRIVIEQLNYTIELSETMTPLTVEASLRTHKGDSYNLMPEWTIIDDGGTGVTFDEQGRIISATHAGTVYLMITFTSMLPDGSPITLTSDLIEINIVEPVIEETFPVVLTIILSIVGIAAVATAGTLLYLKKK
jgi:glycerophosphoryl diester phosphodiesterase